MTVACLANRTTGLQGWFWLYNPVRDVSAILSTPCLTGEIVSPEISADKLGVFGGAMINKRHFSRAATSVGYPILSERA
jgi:hypothetical protein